jgi:hypothetical protein
MNDPTTTIETAAVPVPLHRGQQLDRVPPGYCRNCGRVRALRLPLADESGCSVTVVDDVECPHHSVVLRVVSTPVRWWWYRADGDPRPTPGTCPDWTPCEGEAP